MELVKSHLAGLVRFSGREARQPFWLWAALVVGFNMAAMMLFMIPAMVGTFSRIEAFAAAHPDQVTRTVGPGSYSIQVEGHHPELMPDFTMIFGASLISAVLSIVLLAAAVTRRLHDSDRRGVWGMVPALFLIGGFVGMSYMFASFLGPDEPPMGLFVALLLNNVVYLVSLGVLEVLLALPGTPGENRFGPLPV